MLFVNLQTIFCIFAKSGIFENSKMAANMADMLCNDRYTSTVLLKLKLELCQANRKLLACTCVANGQLYIQPFGKSCKMKA